MKSVNDGPRTKGSYMQATSTWAKKQTEATKKREEVKQKKLED